MIRGRFRAVAIACAAIALGSAQSALPQDTGLAVPSAADFGALPIVSAPAISPDGKLIAAKGNVGGVPMVLIIGLPVSATTLQKIKVPSDHTLEWIRWAGDRRVLVSMSRTDKIFGQEVRLTRLLMWDLDTNASFWLGPRDQGLDGDDLIHIDPAGRFVLLSAQAGIFEYPGVYRADLMTGKSTRIVPPRDYVWSWYSDNKGVVRAGVATMGTKWWVYYRDGDSKVFERTKQRTFSVSDTVIDRFLPIAGSDSGFAIAAGTSGRFGLYRYDFKADSLGERVYENPIVDIDDFDLDRDGKVESISFIDDKPEILWLDPALQRFQARLDRALPGNINRVISSDRTKNRLVVWSGSASEAGTYLLYDRTTNTMEPIAEMYDRLRGKRLATMEPVRYKARDGLEIRAYLTLPAGREAKGLPLVVMPHGGPFARDSWGYDVWAQYLASKGYAVLQPNFRGSTGFGSEFVMKGVGQWGRGMQDDIDDGVKWLAAEGKADAKRVCIMGASFGGYAAMWAAVRNPELYRCAISFAGISDVDAMLRYDQKAMTATRYFRDWRARVQGDKKFELDQISPIKQVNKLKVPILIAHGDKDRNVPMSQSKQLHDELLRIRRAHEYVIYPGEGHGLTDPAHATDFLVRIGKFLDQHNPS
ncbi:MAG: S9 family peptidase [Sphingomonadales bacterium]|nr:MAG: S9 family peptidase [Sphingomonadales bacterium]